MDEQRKDELLEKCFQLLRQIAGIARRYLGLLNHMYPGLYGKVMETIEQLDEARYERILGPARSCPTCKKPTDREEGVCLSCEVTNTIDEAMRRHGITVTAERGALGQYAWRVKCGRRRTIIGTIWLHECDELSGATPADMGRQVIHWLVHTAWVVQGVLETDGVKPEWLTAEQWAEDRALADALWEALPEKAFFALIDAA